MPLKMSSPDRRDAVPEPADPTRPRGHGGAFAGTAALEHLCVHAGLEPGAGLPWTEGWILGAGGLGFSCNVYPGPWGVHLALGFLRPAGAGIFLSRAAGELGLEVEVEETGNAAFARRRLGEVVDDGRPALLWGSRAALPWSGLRPGLQGLVEQPWVVTGRGDGVGPTAEDRLHVADLAPGPLEMDGESLAEARSTLFAAKHRQMTLTGRRDGGTGPERLALRALEATVQGLTNTVLPSQGLPALGRWGESMVDADDPRGWPRLLPPGTELFDALTALWRQVEGWTGGGALRGLYADFLMQLGERAEVPGAAGLEEASERYRELAGEWSALARAALPGGGSGELAEARRLLGERERSFRRRGWRGKEARDRLQEIDRRLEALRERVGRDFPLGPPDVEELRRDLSRRVARLHRLEGAAVEVLVGILESAGDRAREGGRG